MVKKTENKPKSDKKPMSFSEMAKKPGAPQSKAVINMKYSDKGISKFKFEYREHYMYEKWIIDHLDIADGQIRACISTKMEKY